VGILSMDLSQASSITATPHNHVLYYSSIELFSIAFPFNWISE
jgi:hypothetical protein